VSTARQCQPFVTFFVNCLNPVEPGLIGFEQLINFVSSSWFAAKSVEQMIVEQLNFEQFTPTLENQLPFTITLLEFQSCRNIDFLKLILFNKFGL
jgi:hypothetical protein